MKKLNFLLLLVISISFVGAQIPVDSKFNFSDDLNPSEKRLKSMIKGGDEIEGANYLVYLVNNLFAQISKESTLENSYGSVHRNYSSKGIKIRSYCSEILSKYAIPLSNNGNVKSIVSNKILKMRDAVDGYLTVKLGTKQYFIHKLVIENFSNENFNWCFNSLSPFLIII